MGLIFLDGGPLDGNAYDTKDLLGVPESVMPHGYVWTSERRTSPRTGKTAQVWKYLGDPLLDPQQSPGADVADPVAVQAAQQEQAAEQAADQEPVVGNDVVGPAPDVDPPDDPPLLGTIDGVPWEPTPTGPRPEPSPAAPESPPDDDDDEPDDDANEGSYLRRRRKELKVSAGKLAEKAGLKSSRVYAIETNTGKPLTDEERARLLPALDALEAEARAH